MIGDESSSPVGGVARRITWAGLVGYAAFVPVSIAAAQASMGLVLAGWILGVRSWRIERASARGHPLLGAIALFVLVKLVSALACDVPVAGLRAMRGDWTILFLLLLGRTIRNTREAWRLFLVFVVSSGVSGLYGAMQLGLGVDYVRDRPLEPFGRGFVATGFFGHHLTYGGVVLLGLLASFALALHGAGRARRVGWVATLFGLLGIVASLARTAWIGAAAGLVVLARSGGRRVAVTSGVLVVVLGLVLAVRPEIRTRAVSSFDLTDDPRMPLWRTAVAIVRDHPVLGAGPGSFRRLFPLYRVPGEYKNTGHPHNDLLNQLVQVGVVGTLAWILLWVVLLRAFRRGWNAGSRTREQTTLLAAAFAGTVGFLAGGLGQCYFTDEEVVMGEWLLAALGLVAARAAEAPDGTTPPSTPR